MNRALLTYRPIVKFFLLIMGILLGASVLQAAEYEVDGVIYVTLTHYNPPMEFKSEFTVYVRDCAWLISTMEYDQNGNLRGERETGCTNGTEIFDMRTSVIAMSNPSGIRSHTEIKSNTVPVGSGQDDRPEHLWLMFASSCYWGAKTNGQLIPIYDSTASTPGGRNLRQDAEWELINGPGSLPLSVSYFDQVRRTKTLTPEEVAAGLTEKVKQLRARYQANGTTNVGAVTVPNGFVFDQYWPAGVRPKGSPEALKHVECIVTDVRPVCTRKELLPKSDGQVLIADHRLMNASNPVSPFTYKKPKNEWPTATEARTIRANRGKRPVSPFLVGLFVAMVAAPLAYLGIMKLREKARHEMMASGGKRSLLTGYWALAYALGFLGLTGLVPGWGKWYSENTYYREQTDALLKGSLAIEHTPTALRNDLAWHNGGVQQVWGLAVPVWRLPFELLAKVCGQRAFPDRVVFGVALMLVALFAFKVLLPQAGVGGAHDPIWSSRHSVEMFGKARPHPGPLPQERGKTSTVSDHFDGSVPVSAVGRNDFYTASSSFRLAAVLVLLVFPPVVTMCRFHFDIYEEAEAYAYLYGIGLFLGLIAFARAPSKGKYFALTALAGLAPFVRPTLGAFSLPTLLLLFYISRKAKFAWWLSLLGILLFALGGLLLCWTNQVRFGSAFEFGHSLNFNLFPIWFVDRIYNPFQHEPLVSAARELFGTLFLRPLPHAGTEPVNAFWGQSHTPRWRQLYFTTFDLSFLCLLLVAWGWWLKGIIWRKKSEPMVALPLETRLAGVWSLMGAGILALFYLRTPVISSRYLLDFAPGFAAAIMGLLLGMEKWWMNLKRPGRVVPSAVLLAVVAWLGTELCLGRSNFGPQPAVDKASMLADLEGVYPEADPLPRGYEGGVGLSMSANGIPYNGAGWTKDGPMQTLVVLFVNDPDYLQVQLAPLAPGQEIVVSNIQAKVGLEFLALDSVTREGANSVLRFKPPQRAVYRKGIQTVFLAYVDPKKIGASRSPVKLVNVKWRD